MPKKPEKQALAKLQAYVADGHSFTQAAEMAGLTIEQASEAVSLKELYRKHRMLALEETAHKALMAGLKCIGGLAETSVVPQIRLMAGDRLLRFFLEVEHLKRSEEVAKDVKNSGIQAEMQSLWTFSKGSP